MLMLMKYFLGIPPRLSVHFVALRESDVTDLIREDLPFLMCAETSIMRFNNSALVIFTTYTSEFVCPQI